MTTVRSLHEDLLYVILSKCSASIDMWHLLLALDYELIRMVNLRAFWSHIRLTSMHNKSILLAFVKEVAPYCVDLRLDNLDWMIVADLRRLLAYFRSLVCLHTGNVPLSKSTLINDIPTLFPFVKYITLLVSLDTGAFGEFCTSLNQMNQLEHISMVLQDKKGGCLSDLDVQLYFRLVSEYVSSLTGEYKLISIEENRYGIKHRLLLTDLPERTSVQSVSLSLIPTLKHLIVSFRSMFNVDLRLSSKDPTMKKLQLQTLVLPCLPSTSHSIDILDLNQLTILDIGYINVQKRDELVRLDEILLCHRCHSLRNLTINLNEWQSARLTILRREEHANQSILQFTSVFENCFDQVNTPEDESEKAIQFNPSNLIDEFSLDFIDHTQATIFQLPLYTSWLNQLTNLNLTGIHCHSIDLQSVFNSLHLLQSLSLSPCLLFYIDQFECHCQTMSTSHPYHMHSLNQSLRSLNLLSHLSNLKHPCPILLDQYKLHSIRHSSIHQYLTSNESSLHFEYLIRRSIRTLFQTLDLQHISIRIPNYDLHIDDLDIPPTNRLQSLIFDAKIPITLHTKLAHLYTRNTFDYLRRFILISENSFELTPILIDRFRTLEIVEIISMNHHLNRSTINYLEKVLRPTNYPHLQTFRLWIGSVDAKHLIKHAQKTIRTAFEKMKPAFQFDLSLLNPTRQCILYDRTHQLQRDFLSIHSHQLSVIYPKFLNYQLLYSEQKFEK